MRATRDAREGPFIRGKPEMGHINPRFAYNDGTRTLWRFHRHWAVSGILVVLCI